MSRRCRLPALVLVMTPTVVAFAWVAVGLQVSERAPFGVFSLLLGTVIGAAMVVAGRAIRIENRLAIVAASAIAGLGVIAMEHVFFHREYVAAWRAHRAENPTLLIFRPDDAPMGLIEFVRKSAMEAYASSEKIMSPRWKYWLADLTLVLAGAICPPLLLRCPDEVVGSVLRSGDAA